MLCTAAPGIALAALGRQPFLLLACALPLAAWNRPARWPPFLVAAALGLVPIAVVFTIWGGATPPSVRWVGAGLAPKHSILAFAYAGAFTLLFAPCWLMRERRFAWLLVATFLLSMAIGAVEILPMATVAQRFLSPPLVVVAKRAIGSLFVALAVWFVVTLGRRAWAERGDGFGVYASDGVFLLLLSTLKITGNFSSRYVAMTFPMLLPLLAPSREPGSLSAPCRSFLGNALGLASLLSHLGGAAA